MMRRQEDERREQEGKRDRHDRDDDREPARLFEPALNTDHDDPWPPAMSRPSSSTVAVSASRSPTMAPSYITVLRSARARISSRSSLNSKTPTPRSAASRR